MIRTKNDAGVSPVIGIILMVAVTVALVALAATIVFDLGSDVSEPADATIDIDQDSDGDVEAEIVRNENVDMFALTDGEDNQASDLDDDDAEEDNENVASGVGDTMTIEEGELSDDSVSVVADVNGDGEADETLQSEDVEFEDGE